MVTTQDYLFTDVDRMMYEIKTEDVSEDFRITKCLILVIILMVQTN